VARLAAGSAAVTVELVERHECVVLGGVQDERLAASAVAHGCPVAGTVDVACAGVDAGEELEGAGVDVGAAVARDDLHAQPFTMGGTDILPGCWDRTYCSRSLSASITSLIFDCDAFPAARL
jgi:hypothetical protein